LLLQILWNKFHICFAYFNPNCTYLVSELFSSCYYHSCRVERRRLNNHRIVHKSQMVVDLMIRSQLVLSTFLCVYRASVSCARDGSSGSGGVFYPHWPTIGNFFDSAAAAAAARIKFSVGRPPTGEGERVGKTAF
jgi:hypothetical protein